MPPFASAKKDVKEQVAAGASLREAAVAAAFLVALSALAVAFFWLRGYMMYYGDAQAHVNIARRIIDSRTPGFDQIGTVWLPLPHVMMLPFVRIDSLWQSGLAGAIPAAVFFIAGGLFLFGAALRVFESRPAAVTALCLYALNPNLLYLQATPMTEAMLIAEVCGLLYFTVRFRASQSVWSVLAAGAVACLATLTRYEGWFLIPFITAYFLIASKQRRILNAALFGAVASLGPLAWLAHNWWYYSNPLEFYNGPYSAKAIYQRALDKGMARYPGDHEWAKAWLYYRSAVQLCAGTVLMWMGVAGVAAAFIRRKFWPVLLLALPPVFYILSMYSSGTPIFVPHLWPNSYYNTRYGTAALPLLAFAAAALVRLLPARAGRVELQRIAAMAVVVAGIALWFAYPRAENWITWKESQVNSEARRAWTAEAAGYLRAHFRPRDGVFTSFGDLTGIFQQAGIPLRATLHEGNEPYWMAAAGRPDLFLREEWAVAISGDQVASALMHTGKDSPRYDLIKTITIKGAPAIEIYRRMR